MRSKSIPPVSGKISESVLVEPGSLVANGRSGGASLRERGFHRQKGHTTITNQDDDF